MSSLGASDYRSASELGQSARVPVPTFPPGSEDSSSYCSGTRYDPYSSNVSIR